VAIKWVKEINLVNRYINAADDQYPAERIYVKASDYSGATCYFEAVVKNSNTSFNRSLYLKNEYGNNEAVISIPPNSGWSRLTDSASLYDSYPQKKLEFGFSDDGEVRAARLIIIQSATDKITDTETQVEIGSYEANITRTSYALLANTKFWKYESENWDPAPTCYWEVSFEMLDNKNKGSAYFRLVKTTNYSSWTQVDEFSQSGDGNVHRTRRSFTPEDGYIYAIQSYCTDDKYGLHTIYLAKIICQQSDENGISKTESHFMLVNSLQTSTGLKDFDQYYNPDDWDGVDVDWYHEIACGSSAANAKLQEDPNGTPSDIPNSAVTGQANKLVRGSSAMTMPDTAEEIDTYITSSGDLTLSRMVALIVESAGQTYDESVGLSAAAGLAAARSVILSLATEMAAGAAVGEGPAGSVYAALAQMPAAAAQAQLAALVAQDALTLAVQAGVEAAGGLVFGQSLTLAAVAGQVQEALADLLGDATLTAATALSLERELSLAAALDLAADGQLTASSLLDAYQSLPLEAAAAQEALAHLAAQRALDLAGQAGITASGGLELDSDAALAATAAQMQGAVAELAGEAPLSAAAGLALQEELAAAALVTLAAGAELTAAGLVAAHRQLTLAAQAGVAELVNLVAQGALTLAVQAGYGAVAAREVADAASLAAAAGQVEEAWLALTGGAELPAAAALALAGGLTLATALVLSGTAELTAANILTAWRSLTLTAQADLAAAGDVGEAAAALGLAGQAALAAQVLAEQYRAVVLAAGAGVALQAGAEAARELSLPAAAALAVNNLAEFYGGWPCRGRRPWRRRPWRTTTAPWRRRPRRGWGRPLTMCRGRGNTRPCCCTSRWSR